MENKNKAERCELCGKPLDPAKIVYLEFSQYEGRYYKEIPAGHVSQGVFPFGAACAKTLLNKHNGIMP